MNRMLLILVLIGCGDPISLTDEEINEVCQFVNDDNWSSPFWNHSAQEECREARMNIADDQVPCTFGGIASWCRLNENGSIIVFPRGISTMWIDISPDEVPIVESHLVIHIGC